MRVSSDYLTLLKNIVGRINELGQINEALE